jgi:serine protease AprX
MNRASVRRAAAWAVPVALLLLAAPSPSAGLPPGTSAKLDARLADMVAAGASDTVPVWVEFQDKGEDGPLSLARMLEQARASLTPRALARRLRAHVSPLVDYRDLPVASAYLDALAARGLRPYGVSRWLNHAAVRVTPGGLNELAALPFVQRLAPVERALRMREVPAEPLGRLEPPAPGAARATGTAISYGMTQNQIAQLNLPPLHSQGYTGAGVLVCMLDDGFNRYTQHQATMNQVIAPGRVRDFVDGDWDVENLAAGGGAFMHGTWTFATAGGYAPGTFVGSGYGAQFALGRTENDFSEHLVEMVYWGMGAEWADSMGADIISSSLGYNTFDAPDPSYITADMNGHTTTISRAAEIAASKGILVVNSAGNEGGSSWNIIVAPADVDGDSLIAVGAVGLGGSLAAFSSRGPTADGRIKPDLCANGVNNPLPNVRSPFSATAYEFENGTSFSAPLIAGLAACLMQAAPAATPKQIILALRATASQANSPDNNKGYGIANALAAYSYLTGTVGVPRGPLSIRLAGPNPLRAGETTMLMLSPGGTAARQGVVRVLDIEGRVVRHLWTGDLGVVPSPTASWDGRDDSGRYVEPGLYFANLQAAQHNTGARVVFLR